PLSSVHVRRASARTSGPAASRIIAACWSPVRSSPTHVPKSARVTSGGRDAISSAPDLLEFGLRHPLGGVPVHAVADRPVDPHGYRVTRRRSSRGRVLLDVDGFLGGLPAVLVAAHGRQRGADTPPHHAVGERLRSRAYPHRAVGHVPRPAGDL